MVRVTNPVLMDYRIQSYFGVPFHAYNTKTEVKKDRYSKKLDFHFPNFTLQDLSLQRTTSLGDRKLLLQALLIYRTSSERVSKLIVGLEASSRTFHILAVHPCRFISIQSGATPVEYFNTVTPGNRIEFNRSIERALRAAIYDFTVALHSRFIRL